MNAENVKPPMLTELMKSFQSQLETQLVAARGSSTHAPSVGDESEEAWIGMLDKYLPRRYRVTKAFVIDSDGVRSEQIDIVIHDRQYSPFILKMKSTYYVPAEAVYAVFEVKQDIDKGHIEYAGNKISSVRKLKRTTMPIPHAGGVVHKPKPLFKIIGGLLTLSSSWTETFGEPFEKAMVSLDDDKMLDIGCVADSGVYWTKSGDRINEVDFVKSTSPLARFLLELIASLQQLGTVPMIDTREYAKWIDLEFTPNSTSDSNVKDEA